MKFEFNAFEVKKIHSDKLESTLELLFQNDLPAFRNAPGVNPPTSLTAWPSTEMKSDWIARVEVSGRFTPFLPPFYLSLRFRFLSLGCFGETQLLSRDQK